MQCLVLIRLSAALLLLAVQAPGAANEFPSISLVPGSASTYKVRAIALPPGSTFISIAGINAAGQVVGTAKNASGASLWNFLYTPGSGMTDGTVTNIDGSGPPSTATFEGSDVVAINGSGQILLASGMLYAAGLPAQNLAVAVSAAFPAETRIRFTGLNDGGVVSGVSEHPDALAPTYSAHIFRYDPRSPSGVVPVAFTNNRRTFPAGPFLIDNAGDVIYSTGSAPFGARMSTAAGVNFETGCGRGNGQAFAINNSGQIGGGWGASTEFPEICTFDPVQSSWKTSALTTESSNTDAGIVAALNNFGDCVGRIGGSSPGIPTLFTHDGRMINVNTLALFPRSGFTATSADRINDAGEIAGVGVFNGVTTAYLLSPLPPGAYSLQALCTTACFGTALSSSGSAVWSQDGQFRVTSPRSGTFLLPGVGNIQQINTRGDVVGQDLVGRAIVSSPPYTQLDNLNTVFELDKAIATSINDAGDVVGPGGPILFDPILARLGSPELFQINNARQLTGSYSDARDRIHHFLYTPGTGIVELPGQPLGLSNSGHVLVAMFSGPNERYALWTQDGVFPLPAGVQWRALNDRDELVGVEIVPGISRSAVCYSASQGLFPLGPLLLSFGLYFSEANALNNAGQILVTALTADSKVFIAALLTPGN